MTQGWAKEKAYCQQRAQELAGLLEEAIGKCDKEMFSFYYGKAQRYMKRKQLNSYYSRFIKTYVANREGKK